MPAPGARVPPPWPVPEGLDGFVHALGLGTQAVGGGGGFFHQGGVLLGHGVDGLDGVAHFRSLLGFGAGQLVYGPLADRYGRRPILLISNFGLAVDFLFMALAPNLWWLFVGRVLNGMTAARFSTGGAYVADITPPAWPRVGRVKMS